MPYPNIPELFPEEVKYINMHLIQVKFDGKWKLMELNQKEGARVYLHGGPGYLANRYKFQ